MNALTVVRIDAPVTPGAAEIDYMALRYLEAEQRASDAYRIALEADRPHERLKEQLILAVDQYGTPNGSHAKALCGMTHQVRVNRCLSRVVNQEAVNVFAYKVRANRTVHGIFRELFRWTIDYQLQDSAEDFLHRFTLPPELRVLYDRCRKTESVPTLEVHSQPAPGLASRQI